MNSHGTPFSYTNGQFATVTSNIVKALPKALQRIDPKDAIKYSSQGERLELALVKAFEMLYGGHVATIPSNHFVDLSKFPFLPDGWELANHDSLRNTRDGSICEGRLLLDTRKIVLYRDRDQSSSPGIQGTLLKERLREKKNLNANVLEYLLKHPDLIPESWRLDSRGQAQCIWFWGTSYRNSEGVPVVRGMVWRDNLAWVADHIWLGKLLGRSEAAAIWEEEEIGEKVLGPCRDSGRAPCLTVHNSS